MYIELCHLQKFSDDMAIVGHVEGGRQEEYRNLVGNFFKWHGENHLQLNMAKMKEMAVDFRKNKPLPSPVHIGATDIVESYKYVPNLVCYMPLTALNLTLDIQKII